MHTHIPGSAIGNRSRTRTRAYTYLGQQNRFPPGALPT